MKQIFNKLKTVNETLLVCFVIFIGVVLVFIFYKSKTEITSIKETANIENSQNIDTEKLMKGIKYVESQRPPGIGESPSDEEIYNNPYVKHIRVALNGYLDGTNNGVEEGTLDKQDGADTNCGLNSFDRTYYKSKFIVYDVGNNDYGGVQASIVFIDKPDTIFWAWVYQYGGGEYVLRGFCENGPPDDRREEFSKMIKEFLKESKFSL